MWQPLRHIYVMFVVVIAWVFFRSPDIKFSFVFLKKLFGFAENSHQWSKLIFYFNNEFLLWSLFAVLGGAGVFQLLAKQFQSKLWSGRGTTPSLRFAYDSLSVLVLLGMFFLSIVYFTIGSYSPFIYFRF